MPACDGDTELVVIHCRCRTVSGGDGKGQRRGGPGRVGSIPAQVSPGARKGPGGVGASPWSLPWRGPAAGEERHGMRDGKEGLARGPLCALPAPPAAVDRPPRPLSAPQAGLRGPVLLLWAGTGGRARGAARSQKACARPAVGRRWVGSRGCLPLEEQGDGRGGPAFHPLTQLFRKWFGSPRQGPGLLPCWGHCGARTTSPTQKLTVH